MASLDIQSSLDLTHLTSLSEEFESSLSLGYSPLETDETQLVLYDPFTLLYTKLRKEHEDAILKFDKVNKLYGKKVWTGDESNIRKGTKQVKTICYKMTYGDTVYYILKHMIMFADLNECDDVHSLWDTFDGSRFFIKFLIDNNMMDDPHLKKYLSPPCGWSKNVVDP